MHKANSVCHNQRIAWLLGIGLIVIGVVNKNALADNTLRRESTAALVSATDTDVPEHNLVKVQMRSANNRTDVINPPPTSGPTNEFHLARLVFDVNAQHGWGPGRPWWRIDWPEAEFHFLNGLDRYTVIDHSSDSVHVGLNDEALFDYPWLFAQQAGRWYVSDQDAKRLGEYLLRGGFLLVDDIHGPNDWNTFAHAINRALPNSSIEDISPNDSIINILYDLDKSIQIPGRRHITQNDGNGQVNVRMPYGPHKWRGIKDSAGRWMVAINFNMDMGDSWEHADDPYYPLDMTSLGYRLGMNYVMYAITH